MEKMYKNMVAGFMGSIIGTMIALRINPLFWWVGTLVGGAFAFVFVAPIDFCVGVKRAFVETDWNKSFERLVRIFLSVACGLGVFTAVFTAGIFLGLLVILLAEDHSIDTVGLLGGSSVGASIMGILFIIARFFEGPKKSLFWPNDGSKALGLFNPSLRIDALLINPVTGPFIPLFIIGLMFYYVGKGFVFVWKSRKEILANISHFSRLSLLYIDANARLTAMAGAMFGVLFGYLSEGILAGGVIGAIAAGALWGIVHVSATKLRLQTA